MDIDQPTSSAVPGAATAPFDLESYISRYDPHSETRLQRLLFVAQHSTDDADGSTSRLGYEMADRHLRESCNVRRYREVFGAPHHPHRNNSRGGGSAAGEGGSELAPPESTTTATSPSHPPSDALPHDQQQRHPSDYDLPYDNRFVSAAEQTNAHQLETLEARLSTAQSHLAKDAIRTAFLALADFHRSRGELREALRRVLRSREYCSSNRQQAQVCLLIIELGVDLRNWAQVRDCVTKAEHTTDLLQIDPLLVPKLRAASALVHLSESKYADAARAFASVSPDLTNQFNSVLSAEDIALYGALLGLATLDRTELHRLMLDGAAFKGRLELIPPLRDALRHYSRAEYGPCLSLLQSIRSDLTLDLHLHSHIPALFDLIRDRCVVQYFAPYAAVSLRTMGDCFGMSTEGMEKVVADLIRNGKIPGGARIDARAKTLTAESNEAMERRRRRNTRVRAAKLGRTFERETESMILRLSCLEHGLVVSNENKHHAWRGGRGRYADRRGPGGYDVDDSSDDDVDDAAMMMDVDVMPGGMVNPEEV